ncbi:proline--tRNA ligase [Ktedonobacter robiniae]|uniref:Proline--tRNA ligase n=1 Tax=Ktedonobacter robiniae TaxID=2778365 RepID=A0ABQ3UJ41_9CHLR|nr:proline--tRNA ligase [Ktedonobacter robiniae]GHO52422.1 proline--tRNA ligase [Ktedonobacter robiniae]
MRYSQLLGGTLRERAHDVESTNLDLLTRGGFVRQLTSGVYSMLPLGERVMRKLTEIIRTEMERIGGQEVSMPVLQPREIWDVRPQSGKASRAEGYGPVLFSLRDRRERELVLGPTHEEICILLAQEFIRSYRDLPRLVFQIQRKFRDEPRARGGLLRLREFLMKDLYSFDADEEGLNANFELMREAYCRIFARCGLDFIVVEADSGAIGGKESLEFIALTEAGEDTILHCTGCGYAANVEKAEFVRPERISAEEQVLEEVYTPDCKSISDLAAFLGISEGETMKVVCYSAGGQLVMAVVRGDLEINEIKLTNVITKRGLNATDLRLATAEELECAGIVAGYASPLGENKALLIIADHSLRSGNNFVAGANRAEYHLKNVNYPRDFRVDTWADIASAYEGAACVRCGGSLHALRGCELGHIFKLGTIYSDLFNATFLDAEGRTQPLIMASYGIGISRLLACIVEQQHDARGITWPLAVAPYAVSLVGIDLEKEEIGRAAERLYADLCAAGVEVLFDDRRESAGIKFNDADLLGLPLRAVVSKRSLKQGGVELKARTSQASQIVPLSEALNEIQQVLMKRL